AASKAVPQKNDFIVLIPCLERFTVSAKWRTALSLCFYAIPGGKPLTLFLNCSGAKVLAGRR
ncbi:hypothetical protein, partial [Mesorhizobium sp.]|uniref:hypothetical protein n=1 Tax=Mesorhizobium sp. TaxID=1871066 RepID=UPI0025BC5F31